MNGHGLEEFFDEGFVSPKGGDLFWLDIHRASVPWQ
jgi:hypothetical protein